MPLFTFENSFHVNLQYLQVNSLAMAPACGALVGSCLLWLIFLCALQMSAFYQEKQRLKFMATIILSLFLENS